MYIRPEVYISSTLEPKKSMQERLSIRFNGCICNARLIANVNNTLEGYLHILKGSGYFKHSEPKWIVTVNKSTLELIPTNEEGLEFIILLQTAYI